MRKFYLLLLALACPVIHASDAGRLPPPFEIYAGYSRLSNSFNGVQGSHQPLNGMYAGIAFPEWRHLRIKLDYSLYRGSNLGDPQNAFFIMSGGQYGGTLHRERFYVEAMAGEGSPPLKLEDVLAGAVDAVDGASTLRELLDRLETAWPY